MISHDAYFRIQRLQNSCCFICLRSCEERVSQEDCVVDGVLGVDYCLQSIGVAMDIADNQSFHNAIYLFCPNRFQFMHLKVLYDLRTTVGVHFYCILVPPGKKAIRSRDLTVI